ncbi:unnamed protein product [Clonostachys solani]|uniref:Uncharacterized protein n=1 Tax=Clonostachys solani TaxID=160281 RepID=A0A9P0EN88_9HYPO|nr:unnamed protein product [Clonostachys solani]
MSSTVTSARPSASAACSNLYDTPVSDAVCAMPFSNDNANLLKACCKSAPVVSYYDDCGLYCLASGQNVQELIDCLYGKNAAWGDVFCKGNENATATATDLSQLPSTASATIIGTGSLSATGTRTSSSSSSTSTSDKNSNDEDKKGASSKHGVSASGILVASLVLGTALLGMVQV